MKKLLFIDPQSYSNLALYDYYLLKGIPCNIVYCCNRAYDAPIVEGVVYHRIFNYNTKHTILAKFFSYLFSIIRISVIVLKCRPDIIHIQWWKVWEIDYLFLCFIKLITTNIVFTAHNLEPHDSSGKYKNKCKRYYKKITKIIVHSQATKTELVNDYNILENKVFVIPHGLLSLSVDEDRVEKLMNSFSKQYGLSGKIVLTSLGNRCFYKGTDIIWDSFISSDFLKNNSKVVLLFVGKGDIVDEYLVKRYSNVYFINRMVSDEEFIAFLRLSSLTLLPYRKISQSGVLLTAIDNQIPFLVSNVGGLTDPLTFGEVGWCIGDASIENLTHKLQYLMKHEEEIYSVRRSIFAWQRVKAHYNWDNIAHLTFKCYVSNNK